MVSISSDALPNPPRGNTLTANSLINLDTIGLGLRRDSNPSNSELWRSHLILYAQAQPIQAAGVESDSDSLNLY